MMLSTVELVDIRVVAPMGDTERPVDFVSAHHGIPCIKGNWLIDGGEVKLIDEHGETLLISAPFLEEGEVYVHFAIGTLKRRIAHTLTIEDLEKIRDNLSTIIDIAKLERNKA